MDNDIEMKDIGNYRIIRSSENRNAMIGWSSLHCDENHNRWFESTGGGFCDWDDAQYLLDADDSEVIDFRKAHPEFAVRESFWEITCGEDDVVAERAVFVLEEFENGEHRAFTFTLENISLDELEKWKDAVMDWHTGGELRLGRFKCSLI